MDKYKEMYLELFGEVEKAIDILIKAQQKCEEIYVNFSDENQDKE